MELDYNLLLLDRLVALQQELGLDGFNIEVDYEQSFIKDKDLNPNTIYVLTKYLQSDRSIGVETQPMQIFVLSEQNSLDASRLLFSEYAKAYNFKPIFQGNEWVKQQYSDPVVLSNFNTVDYGYRSILYVSVTLYIMENVIDVSSVIVDSESYTPLAFNISYSMSTNTQQLPTEEIASSRKTVSTFAITMTVPLVESPLVKEALQIMNEEESGDTIFDISFTCKVGDTGYSKTITKDMRLISAQLTTAPNQVPGLQLGFMK